MRGRGWPVRRQDDLTDFQSSAIPDFRKKEYGKLDEREGLEWMVRPAETWMFKLAGDSSVVLNLGDAWRRGEPTLSFYQERWLIRVEDELGLKLSNGSRGSHHQSFQCLRSV